MFQFSSSSLLPFHITLQYFLLELKEDFQELTKMWQQGMLVINSGYKLLTSMSLRKKNIKNNSEKQKTVLCTDTKQHKPPLYLNLRVGLDDL